MEAQWRGVNNPPVDGNQQIVVVYANGEALATCWDDEQVEGRIGEIVRWLPIAESEEA